MKYLIKNNEIIKFGLPGTFTRESGELFLGGYETRDDGTSIPNVTDNTAWSLLTTMGYCWYGNNPLNK